MIDALEYLTNKASDADIAKHLTCCDAGFVPTLSIRVSIPKYAQKIVSKSTRFEAWSNSSLIGLAALYCNDYESRIAYITSVSVIKEWAGKGVAAKLMTQSLDCARNSNMRQVGLDVAIDNMPAIKLYEKFGFVMAKLNVSFISMKLRL